MADAGLPASTIPEKWTPVFRSGSCSNKEPGASHEDVHSRRGTMGAGPHAHSARIRRLPLQREYSEFKAVSENALFAYDEGLPGKAWA